MVTQENEKQLLLLRKQIENCILEELSDDEEAIKVAKDILASASLILQKVKTKEELIGIYAMICTRLYFFGCSYISFNEIDFGNILHKISLSLYDCIDVYLSNDINENKLAKSLWPYDSKDIESVKNALSEYIFNNVFIFGPGYIFVHEFISKYEDDIKEAQTPREIMRVYGKIRLEALICLYKCCEEKEYHKALKYDIMSEIIRFMISDFQDLLQSESQLV
jgi:hypothetical protein